MWGAEVVRDSDRGVPVSIFGDVSTQSDLDTQPGITADAAERLLLSRAASGATLLRPVTLVLLLREAGSPDLAYTSVVARANQVLRVFVDARTGVELLRYSSIRKQASTGTGRGVIGDTKKMAVLLQGGAYLADDPIRPPVLTTFDMRNNLDRALNVLFGAPLFVSDIAADSDNNWTDVSVVDAHAYIGWTYDYYFKRHGRRGLDNRDRPLISLINAVSQQGALSLPPELLRFRRQCLLVR